MLRQQSATSGRTTTSLNSSAHQLSISGVGVIKGQL
jgi:hypothetical protein